MIEKGSMFKAWEATTEQQKKAHEMQAIYKAQETARQAIQEAMNRYIKKKTRARSVAKAEADRSRNWKDGKVLNRSKRPTATARSHPTAGTS